MRSIAAALAVLLPACAQPSDPLEFQPGIYTVTVRAAPGRGDESRAERLALTKARAWCAAHDRALTVTDLESGPSRADLWFICVEPGS